ncbi:MAG: ATP-grasp domain-containing protein [Pirellulaceae bacterium]
MKVFIAEWMRSGGMASLSTSESTDSLLSEGSAMHRAVCLDASRCCDHVLTVIDGPLADPLPKNVITFPFDRHCDPIGQWLAIAEACDVAFLIAPETDRILSDVVGAFRAKGLPVLACGEAVIHLTTNKLSFADRMLGEGVPHPRTLYLTKGTQDAIKEPCLTKPLDGCGSMNLRRYSSSRDAYAARTTENPSSAIIQPLHHGLDASIACIVREECVDWLPACRQTIDKRTFAYQGGSGPLGVDLQKRALRLGKAVIEVLRNPNDQNANQHALAGFLGIDILLGETESDDVVIEVNPRLTTSFIGLRELMKTNLVARMLGLETAGPLIRKLSVASVEWKPDGRVTVHAS